LSTDPTPSKQVWICLCTEFTRSQLPSMGVINTTTNKNSSNIDQNFPIPRLTTDFAPL
jgi:hypothetical protein